MSKLPDVVIVMARCSQTGNSFGIRMEQKLPRIWLADWAFPLKEKTAHKEGYGRTEIKGIFGFDGRYPGCPYCQAPGLFRCHDHNACWDGKTRKVTCPWCNEMIELGGNVTSLQAGSDR